MLPPSMSSRRSLGIVMIVSTCCLSRSMPCPALWPRLGPSQLNGRVTTPTVRMPSLRAICATTGAPPGAGAAAHAGGDEHHVEPLKRRLDVGAALLDGLGAHARTRARAKPAREVAPGLDLDVGLVDDERLVVGVDDDERHPLDALLDHVVDGVAAAAAHADDGDLRGHLGPVVKKEAVADDVVHYVPPVG